MEIGLSEQETAFQERAKAFLDTHLTDDLKGAMAASPGVFVDADIGLAWQAILFANGWLADSLIKQGAAPWSAVESYLFEKECARAGAPASASMSLKLLAPVLHEFGTGEQQARLLPRIFSGEDYWCQGFSETGAGSDLANIQTRAEIRNGEYVVNGNKLWTTHAHAANRIFCLVRTDPHSKRQAGISFLLIDMEQPGVTVTPIKTLAGDHEVNQIFFDDATAPLGNLIGEEGQGWAIAKFLLENERGGSCHAPRLLFDLAEIDRLAQREPDGRGGVLGTDRAWRRRIGRLRLSAEALEMIELRIVADHAQGRRPGSQTSLTKLIASSLRQKIDLLGVDLLGPAGLELPQERPLWGPNAPPPITSRAAQVAAARYLNSRAWTIFGGTNEIQAGIIAKTVLGL